MVIKAAISKNSLDNLTSIFICFNNFKKAVFENEHNSYNIHNIRLKINDKSITYPYKLDEEINFMHLKHTEQKENILYGYEINPQLKEYLNESDEENNQLNQENLLLYRISPQKHQFTNYANNNFKINPKGNSYESYYKKMEESKINNINSYSNESLPVIKNKNNPLVGYNNNPLNKNISYDKCRNPIKNNKN